MGGNSSKTTKVQNAPDQHNSQCNGRVEFPVTTSPVVSRTIQNGLPIICQVTNKSADNLVSPAKVNNCSAKSLHSEIECNASNLLTIEEISVIKKCNDKEQHHIEAKFDSMKTASNSQAKFGSNSTIQNGVPIIGEEVRQREIEAKHDSIEIESSYQPKPVQNGLLYPVAVKTKSNSNLICDNNDSPQESSSSNAMNRSNIIASQSNELELFIFLTGSHLQTTLDDKTYDIYYLDLYDDEYQQLQGHLWLRFRIDKSHLLIDDINNQLSIRRIIQPENTLPKCFVNQKHMLDTECIAFSASEPLIAKYRNLYYFVHDDLYDEYIYLLENSQCPLGTSIRMRNDRIVINDKTHFLDIRGQVHRTRSDTPIFVIESYHNSKSRFRTNVTNDGSVLRRYVLSPYESDGDYGHLLTLSMNLVYGANDGDCDEIYAENDCCDLADDEILVRHHQSIKNLQSL